MSFDPITAALNVVGKVADVVKDYFPPSMSDKEQAELSLAITKAENKKDEAILKAANEANAQFNDRIKEMEGTASDLKALPVVGRIVIFLRGMQRPVWGFFTLYTDYQVFAGNWDPSDKQDNMLLAINLLVLGFLFGERAVKNVLPLIMAYFGKSK